MTRSWHEAGHSGRSATRARSRRARSTMHWRRRRWIRGTGRARRRNRRRRRPRDRIRRSRGKRRGGISGSLASWMRSWRGAGWAFTRGRRCSQPRSPFTGGRARRACSRASPRRTAGCSRAPWSTCPPIGSLRCWSHRPSRRGRSPTKVGGSGGSATIIRWARTGWSRRRRSRCRACGMLGRTSSPARTLRSTTSGTASGTCPSRKTARSGLWCAIRARGG